MFHSLRRFFVRKIVNLTSTFTLSVLTIALVSCSRGFKAGGTRSSSTVTKANPANSPAESNNPGGTGTGDANGTKREGEGEANGSKREGEGEANGSLRPGGVGDATAGKRVAEDICKPPQGKRSVLVVDLKSGWFAGDGGIVYKSLLETKCSSSVEFTYFHITEKLVEGNFAAGSLHTATLPCAKDPVNGVVKINGETCVFGSFAAFDQVWLLSGSEKDPDDVTLSSPLFKSLVEKSKEFVQAKKNGGIFLGAGQGNTQHVSEFAQQVLGSKFVLPGINGETGALPNPADSQKMPKNFLTATSTAGKIVAEHPLFKSMPLGLADTGKVSWKISGTLVSNSTCMSDAVAPDFGGEVIAWDACNQAMIGYKKDGERLILVDTNLTRFYVQKPEDYLHKIVNYLAN
jgi:hypothetical protein